MTGQVNNRRPLTDQMQQYLSALYWLGNVKGCGFGVRYDSTRKSLVKRGLVTRHVEKRGNTESTVFVLTNEGVEIAKTLPAPRGHRDEGLLARLNEVKAGGW